MEKEYKGKEESWKEGRGSGEKKEWREVLAVFPLNQIADVGAPRSELRP